MEIDRLTLLKRLIDPDTFPFWVPVISHYRQGEAGIALDPARMLRHARQIYPYTRCWMLGGTTGDGWALDGEQYEQLLEYACGLQANLARPALILGALQPTTEGVLERIALLKRRLGLTEGAGLADSLETLKKFGLVGVTICAPVGAQVTQDQIFRHVSRICTESGLPVVLYQLPQVTHNLIAPETFRALLAQHQSILFFKDSGGGDEVARSGPVQPGVVMVRGAEGGYLEALKTEGGWYDGWLLSTGNAFAAQLAEIVAHLQRGDRLAARAVSERLSGVVEQVFAVARLAPAGNPFSNANRAADHLRAYGRGWASQPLPLLQDGSHLPASLIAQIETVLRTHDLLPEHGYLVPPL